MMMKILLGTPTRAMVRADHGEECSLQEAVVEVEEVTEVEMQAVVSAGHGIRVTRVLMYSRASA